MSEPESVLAWYWVAARDARNADLERLLFALEPGSGS